MHPRFKLEQTTYGGNDGATVVDCTDIRELSISTCVEVTLSTEVNSVISEREED